MHPGKILFLVPYPLGEAPSQRFRFEQYFPALSREDYTFSVISFYSSASFKKLYQQSQLRTFLMVVVQWMYHVRVLAPAFRADWIFIHREVTPVGPPLYEWFLSQVLRKKIIYDFDDAIWHTDNVNESKWAARLRWRSKVSTLCKWSYKVSVGNDYLASFAQKFNNRVVINPTTVDTSNMHVPMRGEQRPTELVIGWTGSHSTLKYLELIEPVLMEIEQKYSHVRFLVIANQRPNLRLARLTFRPWQKATEVADLGKIDIGLMPLPDDEWSKGKCGFKALQYMALEIPCVASPVGVNTKIINHGMNGFLCAGAEEWKQVLSLLIEDADLRRRIGTEGRKRVVSEYSTQANTALFLSLFE